MLKRFLNVLFLSLRDRIHRYLFNYWFPSLLRLWCWHLRRGCSRLYSSRFWWLRSPSWWSRDGRDRWCLVVYCTYACHGLVMLINLWHRHHWRICLGWSCTCFYRALETKWCNSLSILILNLVFTFLHIFKVINYNSSSIRANSNCTTINTKLNWG